MLCLICCFLLYIPVIQAVKVRVNGTVGFEHNFDFPFIDAIENISNPEPSSKRSNPMVKLQPWLKYPGSPDISPKLRSARSHSLYKFKNQFESFIMSLVGDRNSTTRGPRNLLKKREPVEAEETKVRRARSRLLSKLKNPFENLIMSLVGDRTSTARVPRNTLKKREPIEAAIGDLQAFLINNVPDLKPMVPIESKSPDEIRPEDILREIKAFEPDEAKLTTFDVMENINKVMKQRKHKMNSQMVTPDFGYDVTSFVRVTEPIAANALRYKKVAKRKLKKRTKSATRKRETSITAATTDDEIKIKDTPKLTDVARGRTSNYLAKFTRFYDQQALYSGEQEKNVSQRARSNNLVKNDDKAQIFTMNVFSQNVGVFNALRSQINNTKRKNKISLLTQVYRDKFADFVESNQNQKIVTRLGKQKVILNTIETSNRIMRRLFNLYIGDMEKKLPRSDGLISLWSNHVENEEKQEYAQACENLKICRSKYSFSSFLAEVVAILLKVSNEKLKQATDALTEVLKSIELSNLMDRTMQTKFSKYIEAAEKGDPNRIRTLLAMFRNMLINKNKPLVIREGVPRSVINQTVSLMDLIDLLDAKLLATNENVSHWNDLKNSLMQWTHGQKSNILEIMQDLVNMVVKAIEKMNKAMAKKFHDKFRNFLRSSSLTYNLSY